MRFYLISNTSFDVYRGRNSSQLIKS